jgi:phosphatidylserine/phosphatidylglycerophosphate/cardiolipin synthase-like enzyme
VKEPLLSLASSELRGLAAALEAGRLTAPYSGITLQRFVSQAIASDVAANLTELTERGCSSQAIARVMELLAAAIDQRPRLEQMVDLVATGPHEAEGTPRATSVVVGDLFRGARKSVFVAGYAVRQGQKVFKDLADRMAECSGLQVRLYLDVQRTNGDTSMPEEIVRKFSQRFRSTQWPRQRPVPEVYYDPRSVALDRSKAGALHAKCVVVDAECLFISSANFTEAAQERNIEIGLLLNSPVLAGRVSEFFERLIQAGFLKRLPYLQRPCS